MGRPSIGCWPAFCLALLVGTVGCGELLDAGGPDEPPSNPKGSKAAPPLQREHVNPAGGEPAADGKRARCAPEAAFGSRVPLQSNIADPYSLSLSNLGVGVVTFRRGFDLEDPVGIRFVEVAGDELVIRPESVGPDIEAAGDEKHATLSADGLTLVFERDERGGSDVELWIARRANPALPFAAPTRLDDVEDNTEQPYLAGHHLYVSRSERGSEGGLWIGALDFATGTLGTMTRLPSVAREDGRHPVVTADELEIFYAVQQGLSSRVFHAVRTTPAEPFGLATPLLDDPIGDEYPTFVSADACEIYVVSDRGLGRPEVHRLRRP